MGNALDPYPGISVTPKEPNHVIFSNDLSDGNRFGFIAQAGLA